MTKHLYLFLSFSAACRLGGPDGDLAVLTDNQLALDAQIVDSGPIDARSPDLPLIDSAVHDAAAHVDAAPARPDAMVASCEAPPNLACDPVRGTGCLPFTQCIANPSSSAPAANCIFGGLQLDTKCTQDALSTNCPNQQTCVAGTCRKYCYCDADCDEGAVCSGSSGSKPFKVCVQTSSP